MKTTKPDWNIRKLNRMFGSGGLKFDYPIQRPSGQWDDLQKSLLIHSIAGNFPIPPVLLLKSEDEQGGKSRSVDFILDGKQRITNILDFVQGVRNEDGHYPPNAYRLHEMTPTVTLEGGDREYDLAEMFFDELHEDLQAEILSSTLQVQRLEEASDDEITELFFRWNNGTPLTKQQKARSKMGLKNAAIIDDLQGHLFFKKYAQLTPLQRRRSDDEAVIFQTMMLLGEDEVENFGANKILEFASQMKDKNIEDITGQLKEVLDYLCELGVASTLFRKLHLPTLFMVVKKAKEMNLNKKTLEAWLEDFALAINLKKQDEALIQTQYKEYTGAGSTKNYKVVGRKKEMLRHFDLFIQAYTPPVEAEEKQAVESKDKEETPSEKTANEVAATKTLPQESVSVTNKKEKRGKKGKVKSPVVNLPKNAGKPKHLVKNNVEPKDAPSNIEQIEVKSDGQDSHEGEVKELELVKEEESANFDTDAVIELDAETNTVGELK